MKSINYDGCLFSYPEPLFLSAPPQGGGVYVIQVRNPAWEPEQFEPIYFEESDDFEHRGLPHEHRAFGRWCEHPAVQSGELLYVSYLCLPNRSELRRQTEARLIAHYHPTCNRPLEERAPEIHSAVWRSGRTSESRAARDERSLR
jgi:hypothetical protein